MSHFETFLKLHKQEEPLLLGNIWDVSSAKLFEQKGYKAIGTSSQAVAAALGYDDGEKMPFEALLQLAKRVVEVTSIPFTVDIEGGYGKSVAGITENIEKLHDIGVVGINLEDSVVGASRQIQPIASFQNTLSAAANHIKKKNLKIFLNIRTDEFLLGLPNALDNTVKRIKSYEDAGADGIFVPCIVNINDIKEVVKATTLPINVMCMPTLPSFNELQAAGVKRISIGPFVYSYANKKAGEAMEAIQKDGNFASLFK